MSILNQKRILNLIPKVSAPVTIHVSQGDVGTEIEFTLVKGDEVFVNPGNVTASVHGVREDGANFGAFTCTLSGSKVTFPLHSEMTAVKGSALAEIVLVDESSNKVGSANFGIMVEESVFPLGVTYDNDVSVYESILAYAQSSAAQITASLSGEISARKSADALINTRIDEIIAPSGEAPSAAEVTDARIGADGTVYNTLGDAVRNQVNNISNTTRNLWKMGGSTFINAVHFYMNISPGTYTLSATTIRAAELQNLNMRVIIRKNGSELTHGFFVANKRSSFSFTINDSADEVLVYSAVSGSTSVDVEATIEDVQLEIGDYPTEYIPPYTAMDMVAREEIVSNHKKVGDISNRAYTAYNVFKTNLVNKGCSQGGVNEATGALTSELNRVRFYLTQIESDINLLEIPNGYKAKAYVYSGDTVSTYLDTIYPSKNEWAEGRWYIPVEKGLYIRVVIAKENDTINFTPESISDLEFNFYGFAHGDELSDYFHGPYDLYKGDYSKWYSGLQTDYSAFNFSSNTTYNEIISLYDSLMAEAPEYITKTDLGAASDSEYSLYDYAFKPKEYPGSSSVSDASNLNIPQKRPVVVIDAGIHGYEKGAVFGLYCFLKDLVENWDKCSSLESIRNHVELHIIPISNPYGFDNNQYKNANGVNINRNFDHPGEWVVNPDPTSKDYNGLAAFDQSESQIIRDLVLSYKDRILIYLNLHTNGQYSVDKYTEMNCNITSSDRNDSYFNRIFRVFKRHIEDQTAHWTKMYPSIQPTGNSYSSFCGRNQSSATADSTKGTSSAWANTMNSIVSMTHEGFNGINIDGVQIVGVLSADAIKINSENIGNIIIEFLREYAGS